MVASISVRGQGEVWRLNLLGAKIYFAHLSACLATLSILLYKMEPDNSATHLSLCTQEQHNRKYPSLL